MTADGAAREPKWFLIPPFAMGDMYSAGMIQRGQNVNYDTKYTETRVINIYCHI